MGVIIGVAIGYTLGARSGQDGLDEFRDAWNVIRSSEEVKDLLVGGLTVARGLLGRGSVILAGALAGSSPPGSLRLVS